MIRVFPAAAGAAEAIARATSSESQVDACGPGQRRAAECKPQPPGSRQIDQDIGTPAGEDCGLAQEKHQSGVAGSQKVDAREIGIFLPDEEEIRDEGTEFPPGRSDHGAPVDESVIRV